MGLQTKKNGDSADRKFGMLVTEVRIEYCKLGLDLQRKWLNFTAEVGI
jgi:hypothetical protein